MQPRARRRGQPERLTHTKRTTHWSLVLLVASAVLIAAWPGPRSAAADAGAGGSDYWLGFPAAEASSTPAQLVLELTAVEPASGTVSLPSAPFSQSFTVTPGETTDVTVPLSAEATTDDAVTAGQGIHVVADGDVTVDAIYDESGLSDGYLGLPTSLLGTDYIVGAVPGNSTCGSSEFEIVGTQDATTVTITTTAAIAGHAAGSTYAEQLSAGSVYLGQASGTGDVTGTQITSNHPVAVLSGNSCGQVPAGTSAANALMEEEPPVPEWGTEFFTLPFATRTGGDEYVVVTSQPDTTITRNGSLLAGLPNAGTAYTSIITSASHISANKPILVEHLATGYEYMSNDSGDPTMIDVPPDSHYSRIQTVGVPATGFADNFLNVSIATADIKTLTLDGQPVDAGLFSPVGDSTSESGAQISVAPGEHTLEAAGPFGVEAYGFDPATYDAYGFPGGFGDPARATAPTISITAPTQGATYTVGQDVPARYACAAAVGTSISACSGPVASGASLPTEQAGTSTFTVTATDGYGGQSTQTVTYSVTTPTAPATATTAPTQTGPSEATGGTRTATTQTPPAHLAVAGIRSNRATGLVTVKVVAPGPGTLSGVEAAAHVTAAVARRDSSALLVLSRARVKVRKAGTYALIFRPSSAAKRLLTRHHHRLAAVITITYRPVSGKARTATAHTTLELGAVTRRRTR